MPRQKVARTGHTAGVAQAPVKDNDRRHLRGKKGGLKDMPMMPLDILLEIFCQLEPRDLLNLARTTKPFRQFLMNRSSACMWKAARANIEGLPDCPPHLSEPAYANLAFFPYCHCCLKSNVQTILWEFSKRYCPACAKDLTIVWKGMSNSVRYGWAIKCADDMQFSVVYVNRKQLYHCPELNEIEPVWFSRHHNRDDWNRFTEAHYQRVSAVRQHAQLCRVWERQRAANRSEELQEIREQRLAIIVSKLRELGWGEDLDIIAPSNYHPLSENALVRPSKPLSDRAWKKIRDDVVACMAEIKTSRTRTERQIVLCGRLTILKTVISAARAAPPKLTAADACKPRLPDLALMPEIRALVEQPNDAVVDQHSFEALLPNLPAWEQKWRDERTAEFLQILRSSSDLETRDGVDPLKLARTMFKCKYCSQFSHYPAVLAHECRMPLPRFLAATGDGSGVREPLDVYFRCIWLTDAILPLQPLNFEVLPHSSGMDRIVALCGKAPSTTTHQEMDDADPRLAYAEDSTGLGPTVMSWRRAVGYLTQHGSKSNPDFNFEWLRPATEQEREAVRGREVARKANLLATQELWRCGHCDGPLRPWCRGALLAVMKSHVLAMHGVTFANPEQGDMFVHPDLSVEINPILVKEPQ